MDIYPGKITGGGGFECLPVRRVSSGCGGGDFYDIVGEFLLDGPTDFLSNPLGKRGHGRHRHAVL